MSQCNQRTEGAIHHEVPLFASSWVALYYLLRENFGKSSTEAPASAASRRSGPAPGKH